MPWVCWWGSFERVIPFSKSHIVCTVCCLRRRVGGAGSISHRSNFLYLALVSEITKHTKQLFASLSNTCGCQPVYFSLIINNTKSVNENEEDSDMTSVGGMKFEEREKPKKYYKSQCSMCNIQCLQWNCFNLVNTCNIALILFLKCDITKFRIPLPLVTQCHASSTPSVSLNVWRNLWMSPFINSVFSYTREQFRYKIFL